jgi:acyl dehydratase
VLTFSSAAELEAAAGNELGVSDWVVLDQATINAFAEVTGDRQWIHVDVERAATGPFGATTAHGYLTPSLLPRFRADIFDIVAPRMSLNYGLNKVRFPAVVPSGSRVRGRARLLAVEHRGADAVDVVVEYSVEVEGSVKPACVAESVVRVLF